MCAGRLGGGVKGQKGAALLCLVQEGAQDIEQVDKPLFRPVFANGLGGCAYPLFVAHHFKGFVFFRPGQPDDGADAERVEEGGGIGVGVICPLGELDAAALHDEDTGLRVSGGQDLQIDGIGRGAVAHSVADDDILRFEGDGGGGKGMGQRGRAIRRRCAGRLGGVVCTSREAQEEEEKQEEQRASGDEGAWGCMVVGRRECVFGRGERFAGAHGVLDASGGFGPAGANRDKGVGGVALEQGAHELEFECIRAGRAVSAHFALVDGLVTVLAVGGDEFPERTQLGEAQRAQLGDGVIGEVFAHASLPVGARLPARAACVCMAASSVSEGGGTSTLGTAAVPRAEIALGSMAAARCWGISRRLNSRRNGLSSRVRSQYHKHGHFCVQLFDQYSVMRKNKVGER